MQCFKNISPIASQLYQPHENSKKRKFQNIERQPASILLGHSNKQSKTKIRSNLTYNSHFDHSNSFWVHAQEKSTNSLNLNIKNEEEESETIPQDHSFLVQEKIN